MQKQNETAQQKLCTGRHQYREWNLTQSVEAQTMFIKCFWNILWWVIEVVNCIKSMEHKSDSFQAPVSPFPHYNSMQASLRLPSIWLINSTLWTRVTCMIHLLCFLHQISSQLLLAYTFDFVCRYSLPLETSCYQVTKSQWSGSLLVVTAVTLCSTNGVMVYR